MLAAGAGSRFGGGKLLADLDGKPLLAHALCALADAPVEEAIVVIGADAVRLREVCEPYDGVRVVENPQWEEGQSTSVRVGIASLGVDARAVVVLLGDQPFVREGAIGRLVAAFEGGAEVVVATYEGKRRNPVLFSREVWPMLLGELSGDEGARGFIRRHPELVVEAPCDGLADPADVDTAEDLEEARRLARLGRKGYDGEKRRKG